MKIYDIISEAEWQFDKDDSANGDSSLGTAAGYAGAAASGALAARALGGTAAAGAAGAAAAGKGLSAMQRLKGYVERKQDKLKRAEQWWQNKAGRKLTALFWILGLVVPTTQLYAVLLEVDRAKAAGEITDAQYKELRQFHFGVFNTQILFPLMGKLVIRGAKFLMLVRWIKAAGALISAKVTAGISIAAHLASEAFLLWFQHWLGTENGRQWLNALASELVQTLGMPSEAVWTKLMSEFESDNKGKK
jgi:hypothetical protein